MTKSSKIDTIKKERKPKFKAADVIAAIHETRGNIKAASETLGCTRQTLYNYAKRHASIMAALHEARESMKDNVESALYAQALAGNTTAMIFFLKTQAKDRGYVERQELAGAGTDEIKISLKWASKPSEDDDGDS
jgi:hypothetical protein